MEKRPSILVVCIGIIDKTNYVLVVINEFENRNSGISIMNRLVRSCF